MMDLDARRIRLIVGLIAMVATGAVMSLMILAANGAFADDYQITAQTDRAGFGLDDTSEVKIRGVKVGTVESVSLLDDGTVELTFNIGKDIRIPIDAAATIEPLSVFGPKFVDITPGAAEVDGPFLEPGGSLGAIVGPTELAETLDAVATLLETVDTADVSTIVSELGRGFDGLGEELGATIDAAADVAARVESKRPEIDALLTDARALAAVLASRSDSIRTIATDGQDILRTIDEEGEAFGALLGQVSELALRGDDLLTQVGDDLDPTLFALERGAGVLHQQLQYLPDFVDGLDAVSFLLGEGLLQWNRGEGVWGGIGHGVFDFSPCGFAADARCPPREGYTG